VCHISCPETLVFVVAETNGRIVPVVAFSRLIVRGDTATPLSDERAAVAATGSLLHFWSRK
jgi:hypothetical protein